MRQLLNSCVGRKAHRRELFTQRPNGRASHRTYVC